MPDAIQIPQRTPPTPQFVAPEGVIQDYLNYQRNLPFRLSDQIQQGINSLVENQYRKQQFGLERTRAASDVLKDYGAAKANFGDEADALYRPILQSFGYGGQNQGSSSALPSTTTAPPQNGGSTPENYGHSPQVSAQTLNMQPPSGGSSVIADTLRANPQHGQMLGIQNHEIEDYVADPIGFMRKRGKFAADRAQQGLTAVRTQQDINASQPFTQDQSGVVNNPNSTPADLAQVFPNGIPQRAQEAFNTSRNYGGEMSRFQESKQQELNTKQEQIEKEYQEKNIAIQNAINAVKTSLDLKRQSASGPIGGGLASIAGDLTHGAVASPTYLLNQHNSLAAPLLQHSQDVNRFNPQEVSTLKGGGLSLPGEPLPVSEKKSQQVLSVYQQRLAQNEGEKAAKLTALGISYKPQLQAPSPVTQMQNSQNGSGPQAGYVRVQTSDGTLLDIPKQNLGKAQKRDRGLKMVN